MNNINFYIKLLHWEVYGNRALEKASTYTKSGVRGLAYAAPLVGAAGITYLALSILGSSASIIYAGAAIPLAFAAPGLIVGSVSLIAAAFFATKGLAALSIALPIKAMYGIE